MIDSTDDSAPVTPPIFFLGAPRSGTTITFEQFSAHPDLAWLSNYCRKYPSLPAVNLLRRVFDNPLVSITGEKAQFGKPPWYADIIPQPEESYSFWNHYARKDFATDYLLGITATHTEARALRTAVEKVRKYQGRRQITAKLTGPSRIGYLRSVWPDAHFVHIVRNGLDVTRSLLNVHFWKHNGGYERPWWTGGISDQQLEDWQQTDRDPAVLTAMQWQRIMATTELEAATLPPEQFTEIRYEDFVLDSVKTLISLYQRVGLDTENLELAPLKRRNRKYQESQWNLTKRQQLVEWMQPHFGQYGYSCD